MKTKLILLLLLIATITLSCLVPNQAADTFKKGSDLVKQTVSDTVSQTQSTFTGTQVGLPTSGDLLQDNTQVYFSRQNQHPEQALAELYGKSTTYLDIAIYSLTHPVIVKAIGDAYKRGVKVRIVSDKVQSAGATQKHAMDDLITIGIPIKINTHSGLMHIKCSIIDGKIATTGSYNYSMGASNENDEMLVVINEPWFAQYCQGEFDRMWASPQFKDLELSY